MYSYITFFLKHEMHVISVLNMKQGTLFENELPCTYIYTLSFLHKYIAVVYNVVKMKRIYNHYAM